MSYDKGVRVAREPSTLACPLEPGVPALIAVFNELFLDRYRTVLVPGAGEPQYLPGDGGEPHRIEFAHGYFASALHEVAHWCIAGPVRRQQVDFGYWYEPDGRNAEQQCLFEQVEVAPQALEWIFSRACRRVFRISTDNLAGEAGDTAGFTRAVHGEVLRRLRDGLPERARDFTAALVARFSPGMVLGPDLFRLDDLAWGLLPNSEA